MNANKVCVTVAGKREVNMILLALLGLKHNPKSPYYAKPSESHMKINFYLKNKLHEFMLI